MKIMSVDFGDSRTGLAICDKSEFLASPLCVIEEKNFENFSSFILFDKLPTILKTMLKIFLGAVSIGKVLLIK